MDLAVRGQRHFNLPVLHVYIDLTDLRVRRVVLFLKGFVAAGAAGQNKSTEGEAEHK